MSYVELRFLGEEHLDEQQDDTIRLGRFLGVPVVALRDSWFPLAEVLLWAYTTWRAGVRRPERSLLARIGVGFPAMIALHGMEWLHNFSHLTASRLIGQPMDAMRLTWGQPLCAYLNPDDATVTPRQHIGRALGGPVANLLLVMPTLLLRRRTQSASVAREVADTALQTNLFLALFGLLPIPGLDGGAILKWALVESGHTPEEADRRVLRVSGLIGLVALPLGAILLRLRRPVAGVLGVVAGSGALAAWFGWVKAW